MNPTLPASHVTPTTSEVTPATLLREMKGFHAELMEARERMHLRVVEVERHVTELEERAGRGERNAFELGRDYEKGQQR